MIDKPEAVDHDLPLHGLDRVHHNPHSSGVQLLKALLRIDVLDAGPSKQKTHDQTT